MPLIPNKREFFARRMRDAGVLRLIERAAGRPGLLVLTYHRIGSADGQPFYPPIWSATPEAFREQVTRLRDTFRILSLDEAVAAADDGFRGLKGPVALVTFDDGQRDNYEVARPILRELGVPATFFLPTAYLDAPRLPWWDHLAYTLNTTGVTLLRLDRPTPLEIDLRTTSRADAIAQVVKACLDRHVDVNDEAGFLAHLDDRAEVSVDSRGLGRTLFMTWDEARDLAATPGLSVGSHASTHRTLALLSEDEQGAELGGSRRVLERELGRPVDAVAYPYGWAGAFDAATTRAARASGYRLGFSSVEGVNRPGEADPMALRRLGVGSADSPVLLRARLALTVAAGRSWL